MEEAFATIFQAQDAGRLQWRRIGEELQDFTTEVVIKNAKGEETKISVYFFTSFDGEGIRSAFLTLITRGGNAPCRNDYDKRVQKLFTQLTRDSWSADPIMDRILAERTPTKPRRKFLGIF